MTRLLRSAVTALFFAASLSACAHGVTHHPGLAAAKTRPHSSLSGAPVRHGALRKLAALPRLEIGQNDQIGHVFATVYHHGKFAYRRDLGFGTVTNLGTDSMANDPNWASPSGATIATLALAKYCTTGTGTTSAAATDIALQTADAVTPVAGTPSVVLTPNAAAYKVVCTLSYTGTEAVTEWGLQNSATSSATTGTPWTAGSATTGTVTGTPYTASSTTVQGEQQFVFEDTTLSCYALATSNTTSVVTVPVWSNVGATTLCSSSGHAFPQNTDGLKILALLFDHQVFSAINVVNGDSIQFTFTLTLPSGG